MMINHGSASFQTLVHLQNQTELGVINCSFSIQIAGPHLGSLRHFANSCHFSRMHVQDPQSSLYLDFLPPLYPLLQPHLFTKFLYISRLSFGIFPYSPSQPNELKYSCLCAPIAPSEHLSNIGFKFQLIP